MSFFLIEMEPNNVVYHNILEHVQLTTLLTNAIELELPAFPNAANIGRMITCIKKKMMHVVT
jgi:hypothetical protein